MHLVLNLHDGDKLTFEELTDARNLDAIDFDLDKAESLDLYYGKYNAVRLWFDDYPPKTELKPSTNTSILLTPSQA